MLAIRRIHTSTCIKSLSHIISVLLLLYLIGICTANVPNAVIDNVSIASHPIASTNDLLSTAPDPNTLTISNNNNNANNNSPHSNDGAVSNTISLSSSSVIFTDENKILAIVPDNVMKSILTLLKSATEKYNIGPIELTVTKPQTNGSTVEQQLQQTNVVLPFYTLDTPYSTPPSLHATNPIDRAEIVRSEFLYAYHAYEKYAWGQDELRPVSRQGHHSYGMALTLVDSLTTMILMNCTEELERAVDYIEMHLHFEHQRNINVFETTIRVLGALLSSFALTTREIFRTKSREVGDQLMYAFSSRTGLPYGTISFDSHVAYNPQWTNSGSSLSEVGTLQLEFQYLSTITGNRSYEYAVDKAIGVVAALNISLYPLYISVDNGDLLSEVYTLGARVDSLYEYFLKQFILSKKSPSRSLLRRLYEESVDSIVQTLLSIGESSSTESISTLIYIAEKASGKLVGKVDHLVCFFPGVLALGVYHNVIEDKQKERTHLLIAKSLMKTCVQMYFTTATGLAPEIVQFRRTPNGEPNTNTPSDAPPFDVDLGSTHSLLRPETVESLFILYRLTHEPIYRDWGWQIFQSLVKYSRLPNSCGYSGLKDVRRADLDENALPWSNWNDHTESFFYSETLKYIYLLHKPEAFLPLDDWVLNTEAHPLPIRESPEDEPVQAYEDGRNTLAAIREVRREALERENRERQEIDLQQQKEKQ